MRATSNLPVIMLTAMGEETDRIIGLEMGADDYVPKPFSPRELMARIKAVLRRSQNTSDPVVPDEPGTQEFEGWHLDTRKRELTDAGGVLHVLSSAEYDLLKTFVDHPERVLNRDQLLDLARGREAQLFDRSIDTLVSRLRKKLEQDPKNPEIIKTVWGSGYIFTAKVRNVLA